MGYVKWDRFEGVIQRAMVSARNQGLDEGREFPLVNQVTAAGNLGEQSKRDCQLSRMAAYLVAMNGDPNKPEVASAQAYFAIMTREAELNRSKSALELLRDQIDVAIAHERRIAVQERRTGALESKTEVLEAKVSGIEGEHDWFAALGYAKLNGYKTDRNYLASVGKMATRLMRERGEEPHKRQDATFGAINVYPAYVLREAFLRSSRTQ
jgi:DNA-damage-inducible protein D